MLNLLRTTEAQKELHQKLSSALEKACLVVEGAAKEGCPASSGHLRNSITHEVNESALEGVIGSNVEYAPYVEIGTGIFSSEGNGRQGGWVYFDEKNNRFVFTYGQTPQPFLKPALENNMSAIEKCFEGIL